MLRCRAQKSPGSRGERFALPRLEKKLSESAWVLLLSCFHSALVKQNRLPMIDPVGVIDLQIFFSGAGVAALSCASAGVATTKTAAINI